MCKPVYLQGVHLLTYTLLGPSKSVQTHCHLFTQRNPRPARPFSRPATIGSSLQSCATASRTSRTKIKDIYASRERCHTGSKTAHPYANVPRETRGYVRPLKSESHGARHHRSPTRIYASGTRSDLTPQAILALHQPSAIRAPTQIMAGSNNFNGS
jgi:hypothetical protein